MRILRIGSRKQLTLVCGVVAVTCVLFLINDFRKSATGMMTSHVLHVQSQIDETPGHVIPVLNDQTEKPGHPMNVLIVTYMRSGSSLTGDILQQADGAFYVYEPFRLIERALNANQTLHLVNGSVRSSSADHQQPEAAHVIRNWFTCNIHGLYRANLNDGFLSKGLKTRMFAPCLKNETVRTKNNTLALDICARRLQDLCLQSPIRIIKTIRISLEFVKPLIKELPNFKIVHLVRDPRATLTSQSKLGMCKDKHGGKPGCTQRFCKQLENDLLEEEHLLKDYPNNIMPLLYEDLALRPLETSSDLFKFVGTTFSRAMESYVYNITRAGNPNNCNTCTTRGNSSLYVNAWQKTMGRTFVDIVQERCNYILKRYNYPIV